MNIPQSLVFKRMRLYPHSKGGGAYYPGCAKQVKFKWVWPLFCTTIAYTYICGAREDGASCHQHYSSIIRRRVAIASAMFTRRARAGSAEAWRA